MATITAASIANCHGNFGSGVGCTITATGTHFPWRVTPINTTRIEIHTVEINLSFEQTPGTLNECPGQGTQFRWFGTVIASFTPNATPANRRFDFDGATGLFGVIAPATPIGAVAPTGSATPTGLLNIID